MIKDVVPSIYLVPSAILNRLIGIQRYAFNEEMSDHIKKKKAKEDEQILEEPETVKPQGAWE